MELSTAEQIGTLIRNLRKAQGLTQQDIAQRIGTSYSYIGRLERGENNVTIETLEKVAIALDMNFFEMLSYAGQKEDDLMHGILGLLRTQDQKTKEKIFIIIQSILEMNQKSKL